MTKTKRAFIVGGVAGGASCAARLRRLDEQVEIVLLDRGPYVSFANCGLPYYVGDVIQDEAKLLVATPELFRRRFNIEVRTQNEVLSIDRGAREIDVRDLVSGRRYREKYDVLVLSPGAAAIRPPLPGIDLPGIFTLRTVPDSRKIREWIDARSARRAVVVGGGFIGLEMAENLVHRGIEVTIVEMANQLIDYVRLRALTTLGTRVALDLRHKVYEHMHNLSLRFFAKRRTGSLITRVTTDTDRLWDFIVFGSVNLIRDALMIVVFAGVMFYFNWKLAIAALLPVPPLAILTYYRSMRMTSMFGRLWTYWSRLTAVVGDALPGVRVVKAFSNEQRELDRFDQRSEAYSVHEQEVNNVWAALRPIISGTMSLGRTLVWFVGGWLIIRHPSEQNSLGTLFMFNAFVTQFYEPIMELANSNRMVTRAASSATRVFEVLDTAPEIYSTTGATTKGKLEGRVEFRQVSFSYEGAQPALREVSVTVEPGQMIGLCGPSGAERARSSI